MLYALLVACIAIFNLALGFVAAARLGWGPTSLKEFWLGVQGKPGLNLGDYIPTFADEIDVKRLIDFADQRLRKIRNCKVEIADPLQRSIYLLQLAFDSFLLTLEGIELRMLVTRYTHSATGWNELTQSIQTEVHAQLDSLQQSLDEVNAALSARDQHRFINPRTQLSAKVLSSRPEWQAWAPNETQIEESIELFQELIQRTHREFSRTGYAALGFLHDLLGEAQPAMEWDPTLHRDPSQGNQTILAIDAERRLTAEEGRYWIARVRLDQSKYWNESLGMLFFHAVGDRLADRLSGSLPGHWLIVPLPGGEILIRGEMESLDEFTRELDRFRHQIAHTAIRLGSTHVSLTASAVVIPDHSGTPTQFRVEELVARADEVEAYGGNRVFVCEDGIEIPVMPLDLPIADLIIELA